MGTWLDGDGLYRKFGPDKATPTKAGEFRTNGALREIEIFINDMTTLTSTAVIIADVTFFPTMRIEEVEVVATTAVTSGGSATLDLGLIRTNRSTEISYEAFLNAAPIADYNTVGEKIIYRIGTTGVGLSVGTTPSNPGYITANYNTAAYTAGALKIIIRFRAI